MPFHMLGTSVAAKRDCKQQIHPQAGHLTISCIMMTSGGAAAALTHNVSSSMLSTQTMQTWAPAGSVGEQKSITSAQPAAGAYQLMSRLLKHRLISASCSYVLQQLALQRCCSECRCMSLLLLVSPKHKPPIVCDYTQQNSRNNAIQSCESDPRSLQRCCVLLSS
jgi:hypothetical protein